MYFLGSLNTSVILLQSTKALTFLIAGAKILQLYRFALWATKLCCTHFFVEHLLANLEHYEVIVPVQVDEQGTAITSQIVPNHRRKRQVSWKEFISPNDNHTTNNYPAAVDQNMELESNEVHYMLSAYGKLFHLNLTLSADFLAANFAVEYRTKHNVSNVDTSSASKCHYKGHLRNTPNSRVIISNCLGLVSI